MRRLIVFLCFLFASISLVFTATPVYGDELDEINKQLEDLQEQLANSKNATEPLVDQLDSLTGQLSSIEARVAQVEVELDDKRATLEEKYATLEVEKDLFDRTVREYYMKNRLFSPLFILASGSRASDITRILALQRSESQKDKSLITSLTLTLVEIEEQQRRLEEEEARLASIKTTLDAEREELATVIEGARDYQAVLSSEIEELTARQTEIINARSGGFTVSGDSELADDPLASIKGFRDSAPGGHFAIFSFGAYSHRNGMSQYGALGRAKKGQNAEEILKAYYPGTSIKNDYSVMDQITVEGVGSGSFEDWYMHRIYEVPESWPKEVLKAQAIAARTYAIRHTNNGAGSICANEGCQVFKDSPKTGAWKEAVEETKGVVLVDGGGNPVSTQYASTHGGWSRTSGWDTTDGSGGSDLLSKAYDAIGGSPWLYKAWWREGYSRSGATCGRSNPWLSPTEMADIVNAHLVITRGSSDEAERVVPVTTDCWGGNPYSHAELQDVAGKYGGISSASSVSVTQGDGRTNNVTINGVGMSGDDFCRAFNLRAPGYLRIPQWSGSSCGGAFFNIEHK